MINETWKAIPNYEGFYEASSLGNVRSLNRTIIVKRPNGKFQPILRKGRPIKAVVMPNGYETLSLTKGNVRKQALVHRLVMQAFVGPCPDGREVCHENGIKTDNRLQNLRYDTPSANQFDRIKHGNFHKKLSDTFEEEIVRLKEKMSFREIGRRYGVTHSTVSRILRRKSL